MLAGCSGAAPPPKDAQDSHVQQIMINTPGVEGVSCVVQNTAGSWNVSAPGPVTIPRTPYPLDVYCYKGEHLRGSQHVVASFAPVEAGAGANCVSCRYPGIVEVPIQLNDSLMHVPVLRFQP